MKRFFGLMPANEVTIEKTFETRMGDTIQVQAGPKGWTIIFADSSAEFEDVEDEPNNNLRKAITIAKGYFTDLVDVTPKEPKEFLVESPMNEVFNKPSVLDVSPEFDEALEKSNDAKSLFVGDLKFEPMTQIDESKHIIVKQRYAVSGDGPLRANTNNGFEILFNDIVNSERLFKFWYNKHTAKEITETGKEFLNKIEQVIKIFEDNTDLEDDFVYTNESFSTVGELRELLEGLPDDRLIIPQVVANDGTAWNMVPKFLAKVPNGDVAVLTLSHSQLNSLNNEKASQE